MNIELIIIDDCSKDSTWSILNSRFGTFRNVQLIRNNVRKGLPGSRNVGIAAARGELVFFMEDDLVLEKNLIELLVKTYNELSENNKVAAIAPRLIRIGDVRSLLSILVKTSLLSGDIEVEFDVAGQNPVEVPFLHSCVLILTAVLRKAGGYVENCYSGNYLREESDLYCRLRSVGFKFFYEPKAVVYHHMGTHGGCHSTLFKYFVYSVRNHLIFLVRFEKERALYKFPFYPIEFLLKWLEGRNKKRLIPQIFYRKIYYCPEGETLNC